MDREAIKTTPAYFLRTERLGFRVWTEEDYPLAQRLWGDPAVTRMIGGPWTEEDVRALFDEHRLYQRDAGFQYWLIVLLENNAFVGCGGLRPHRPSEGIAQIGFHFLPACWRQGFAREAAHGVIRYAFDVLHLHGLFAGHHPDNVASRALLVELGFVHTGESFYAPTGLMHPTYLLRREQR